MSTLHERRLGRMTSAQDMSSTFRSPLAQVRDLAHSIPTSNTTNGPIPLSAGQEPTIPPQGRNDFQSVPAAAEPSVPPLNLNLFRSPSVYSVSSVNTLSSFESSSDDYTGGLLNARFSISSEDSDSSDLPELPGSRGDGAETPTTPRANPSQFFDFSQPAPSAASPRLQDSRDEEDVLDITRTGPRHVPTLEPFVTGNQQAVTSEAELASGQLTPKRSFFVRSRPVQAPAPVSVAPIAQPQFRLQPLPHPPSPGTHSSRFQASPYQAESGPGPSTLTSRSLAETHADAISRALQASSTGSDELVTREGEVPISIPRRRSVTDTESIHGEQGSEWGDDEQGFESVDNSRPASIIHGKSGRPDSPYGTERNKSAGGRSRSGSRTSMSEVMWGGGKLFMSPKKSLAKLRMAVPGLHHSGSGPGTGTASASEDESDEYSSVLGGKRDTRKLQKHVIMPRRAAPPPPPGPGSPRAQAGSVGRSSVLVSLPANEQVQQSREIGLGFLKTSPLLQTGSLRPHSTPPISDSSDLFAPPSRRSPAPHMVPLRSDSDPLIQPHRTNPDGRSSSRDSGMSLQSLSYSISDLDGRPSPSQTRPTHRPASATPRVTTPSDTEAAFPQGTHKQVPVSSLGLEASDRGLEEHRGRYMSDPARSPSLDMRDALPHDLLDRGVQARSKGDMAKAAWYFRQAADGGSSTGRMYWGLALRHGWGVAKDDRKAFAELKQACDESLAEGAVEVQQIGGTGNLTIQQKKALTRDLSLSMFEVANCFLDGAGVKKDSDVAVSYLRYAGNLGDLASQERTLGLLHADSLVPCDSFYVAVKLIGSELGFLLSKGGNGIKKDMKEAAKWYRMAIGQGSTTIGLAWVWKVSVPVV